MVLYKCDICKFSTSKKTDHTRHCNTKRHLKKVFRKKIEEQSCQDNNIAKNDVIKTKKCEYCDELFLENINLQEHLNVCRLKKLIDKKISAKLSQYELENKNEQIRMLQRCNKTLENAIDFMCNVAVESVILHTH